MFEMRRLDGDVKLWSDKGESFSVKCVGENTYRVRIDATIEISESDDWFIRDVISEEEVPWVFIKLVANAWNPYKKEAEGKDNG